MNDGCCYNCFEKKINFYKEKQMYKKMTHMLYKKIYIKLLSKKYTHNINVRN